MITLALHLPATLPAFAHWLAVDVLSLARHGCRFERGHMAGLVAHWQRVCHYRRY